MSTNKSINLSYTYFKEFDCYDVHLTIYAPPANVERKYIIEYKIPKTDVLDEKPAEYVSILIQLTDAGYDILNVYFRGRNHKTHGYVSPFRIMLDKVVPQIEV
jgi:hypothetical protein